MSDNFPYQTIWATDTGPMSVCKVAIAGDFLPAMSLSGSESTVWHQESQKLALYFDDVDITMVNLESAVNVNGLPPKPKTGLGANLNAPEECLLYLARLRTQVVGLANNHIYDTLVAFAPYNML